MIVERKCLDCKLCLKLIEIFYWNYVMDIFLSKSVDVFNYYILLCLYLIVFVLNINIVIVMLIVFLYEIECNIYYYYV